MKSRKFPTTEEATAYLKSHGELKYWGREGTDAKTYVYSLIIGGKVYDLLLNENGYLQVTHERYKRSDE